MTGWVILVDHERDFPNADTPHKVITTATTSRARSCSTSPARTKLVNLSRSYNYQSKGYYASLLAEARGHRIIPTVETMLELREQKLYEHALPELEDALNRCARRARRQPRPATFKLLFCFGIAHDPRFETVRAAAVRLVPLPGAGGHDHGRRAAGRSTASGPRPLAKLGPEEAQFFREALHQHTQRDWRDPKARSVAKYSLAVLYDPNEKLPPSSATRSSISRASPRSCRSRSSRSPSGSSPSSPNSTRCSSARPPRSTTTPTASPAAPAGGHAGHRRSDVDDPLHQQGLPEGAARAQQGADAARP